MSEEDPIETTVGRFGRYQTCILVLILLGRYPIDFQLNNVVFIIPSVEYKCLDESAFNASNYCPCQNPEYDQSNIISSVTTEWNLICERSFLATLAQSMLQVGILAGSVIFGHISDRHGRKIAVLLSLSFQVLFVALSAFVTEYWMFLICRFMIGATVGATLLCTYVLLVELSGKSFRPYLVGLTEISFITGYITLPIIAYFVREWRYLQLVTSLPWIFVISYYWLLPESPRWLMSIGKKREAVEILTYIAKKNKRQIENIEGIVGNIKTEKPGSLVDLFKTPKIRIYTIIKAFIWMSCSHTFFGVNQYIGQLQGNLYLNVLLSASFLAPGLILVVLGVLYLKRKVSVITSFTVTAISLLIIIFISDNVPITSLPFTIIGQIGAYTSFLQMYLYASEVFPTVIRNSAMGFLSIFATVGGFTAPFVVNIGIQWVSLLIFSGVASGAAILCTFLPETKGMVLLNTIEETERPRKPIQS